MILKMGGYSIDFDYSKIDWKEEEIERRIKETRSKSFSHPVIKCGTGKAFERENEVMRIIRLHPDGFFGSYHMD